MQALTIKNGRGITVPLLNHTTHATGQRTNTN